jgi:hypothetical protein
MQPFEKNGRFFNHACSFDVRLLQVFANAMVIVKKVLTVMN